MRAPPRHAIIHLPALAPEEVVRLIGILDRLIDGIWRAHGPAIEAWCDEMCAPGTAPGASRSASPSPPGNDGVLS